MGQGMAYGGLSFPYTGCLVQDVYIYYVPDMINVWNIAFTFIHLLWMFPRTDILFYAADWEIQNGPPLYQIYILHLG